ncbi:esterase/lipase family protein [Massilia agri]|uniref:GPI inositol-deacylase n=1 Tax=Massilia agri TaxID=1886785 RepID=A0ABT2AM62_9BURK|nr:GPI inositol-deacylase [Massilia agri]MCS0597339.1 GPI inositol-deacylase [Massilia agri]
MAESKLTGYKLPVNPAQQQGTVAQGFVTPNQDRVPQVQSIPPKRVLPVIFIPGIMGSNLRMSSERQQQQGAKNNIAWRPDNLSATVPQYNDSASERQLRLDPLATEVDIYDPNENVTGDPNETADQRNDTVRFSTLYDPLKRLDGPLLQSDPPRTPNPKTKDQKARERGWGEVYFSSYQDILSLCELRLNAAFSYGSLNRYLSKFVVGVEPSKWQAHPTPVLKELGEKRILEAVKGCWFPVHAMGYNWLRGNAEAGTTIAKRITVLMATYQEQGFQCEKVILVTHSMGGLVARAVLHPDIGNLNDKVLGVVHGVMPAIGAGTAYKRVRCGFEGNGVGAKILGRVGPDVTAVLANAQGGLELLPSQAYGNHWLQAKQKGKLLMSLPENGDPYEEIYKVRGKWYGLLREEWLNPGRVRGAGFKRTCGLLDRAKDFHNMIANTYHDQSYAHYGADAAGPAWHKVVWQIDEDAKLQNVSLLTISGDSEKGKLTLFDPNLLLGTRKVPVLVGATLLDPAEPGDQTVPLHSADAQLRSGKFKGIFRQTGYEHQASYGDSAVLAATIYSLFQIASTMKWTKQ